MSENALDGDSVFEDFKEDVVGIIAGTEEADFWQPKGASSSSSALTGHKSVGFIDLGLRPELQEAIEQLGFEHPSAVQAEALPSAILGHDIICQAQSGMGKTVVFVFGVLHQLEVYGFTQCIVLLHARELACQVAAEFERFAKFVSPSIVVASCHPDVALSTQKAEFQVRKPTIVVGTPGRVLALCRAKAIDPTRIRFFVIDEADAMLNSLDVRSTVQDIFRMSPVNKQVMLMTATLDAQAHETARKFVRNPIEVVVASEKKLTLPGLLQYYLVLNENEKPAALERILDAQEFKQCLIFCQNSASCGTVTMKLTELNFPALTFTEDTPDRVETFERLQLNSCRSGSHGSASPTSTPIVVTTNVFARGVDFGKCDLVIQYDLAESVETYIHRIGRCGRFGSKGLCIAFVSSEPNVRVLKQLHSRFSADLMKYTTPVAASSYMTA